MMMNTTTTTYKYSSEQANLSMMCRHRFAQAGKAGMVELCSAKEGLQQHYLSTKMGPTLTCPLSHMHASSETIIIIIIIIVIRSSEKKSWQQQQQQQTHSIHSLLHLFFSFLIVFSPLCITMLSNLHELRFRV